MQVKPRLRLANQPVEFIATSDWDDIFNIHFVPYVRTGTKWTVGLNWRCDGGGVTAEGHTPGGALLRWQREFAASVANQFANADEWKVEA